MPRISGNSWIYTCIFHASSTPYILSVQQKNLILYYSKITDMARIRDVDVLEDEEESVQEGEISSSSSESGSVSSDISNENDDRDDIGDDHFSPPLYRQRYETVSSILRLHGPNKRIVDFGCAEGKFISLYLKKLEDVQEIVGVDLDEYALESARHRTAPLIYEHLHPRKKPLDIYLMNGDIGEFDERLKNVDAVSAIEVVEHLSQITLDNFKEMLFGHMKPRIIVITTPNAEYNVLFSNMSGFRHPDHVFEWDRADFRAWCNRITDEFSMYSVSFSGVGFSVDNPQVGPCSQIATFHRNEDTSTEEVYIRDVEAESSSGTYNIYIHHKYPIDKDDRSFEEKLNNQLEYYINDCCRYRSAWENDEDDYLPLSFLSQFSLVAELTTDIEVIRWNLIDHSWEVVELDGEYHVVVPPMNEEYISSEIEEEENYNLMRFNYSDVRIDIVDEETWD